MAEYIINFESPFGASINNDSLQIGDYAYSVQLNSVQQGGFNISIFSQTSSFQNFQPVLLGVIVEITNTSITINDDDFGDGTLVGSGDFIMFAKDSRINLSGLVGYYAQAEFRNSSTEKAEMYSVGSEITPSSK
tara:strand:- start:190 stop:591 length:402 start_codon:yes stop_codon:yes gene_type:complete